VNQSFESSLKHFNTDYIDSFILHGPSVGDGLADADHEVWAAMEALQKSGRVKYIGASNCHLEQIEELWEKAKIKPTFLQNRCFSAMGWDYHTRQFCEQKGIQYQGFSLLTANSRELQNPFMFSLVQKYEKTLPQIVFRFCLAKKMIILTGTTNIDHMRDDLNADSFTLTSEEIDEIEKIGLR
jgi:diketogulonate reductase-like aldo/keto reductase